MKTQTLAIVGTTLALGLSLATGRARAQAARQSQADVGVANLDLSPSDFLTFEYNDSSTGAPVTAEAINQTFSGMDSVGQPATMTFSGNAWAASPALGRMQTLAAGSLSPSFYNPENPPYFDATQDPPVIDPNGVPDLVYSHAAASFTDILTYGGFSGQRNVRYIFHIDGLVHGEGMANTMLTFTVSGSLPEYWMISAPPDWEGKLVIERGTEAYLVSGQTAQTVQATFQVDYEVDLRNTADGSDIVGAFDFSSTAVLDRIEMTDMNGNIVTDWTVQADSGTSYPTGPGEFIFANGFEPEPQVNAMRLNAEICRTFIASTTHSAALRKQVKAATRNCSAL